MRSRVVLCAIAAAAIATTLVPPTAAEAGTYPVNKCVAAKLKAASAFCKADLMAYAAWVGSGYSIPTLPAVTKARAKLEAAWSKAEGKSLAKGVDCSVTTVTAYLLESLVTSPASDLIYDVVTGLDPMGADAKCGGALLKAAADRCAAFLKSESGYIQKLAAGKTKRDAANAKAETKFNDKVTAALIGCPTVATQASIDEDLDTLTSGVITNTTISPFLDDTQFTTITPGQNIPYEGSELDPICSFNTPYHFFVKKGTVNKLVMYYQGGGACWDYATCNVVGTMDKEVIPNGTCTGGTNDNELCDDLTDCPDQSGGTACTPGPDNPNNTSTGFGDLTNPLNPFKDWNIVFVSYCTGDIHFGDAIGDYGAPITRHKGWHNARVAEKFAREHFVAPDEVFVTGSSAGAYGAFFNAPLNKEVWPSARFSVLADAGNGIITEQFLDEKFPHWNFEAHLPTNIPGVVESIEDNTGIPAFTKAVADYYPDVLWAHYSSSYDGGTGGQTGFYNVMLNLFPPAVTEWPKWWNASCEWNDVMVAQAHQTAIDVPNNYRYFIGTGSRHTMYGSNKVYTDVTGGVPTIVSWVNQMITRDPLWDNVECTTPECAVLLTGDPRPSPLQAPFEASGPDTIVNCP